MEKLQEIYTCKDCSQIVKFKNIDEKFQTGLYTCNKSAKDGAIKSFWCGDETRRCYMEKAAKPKRGKRKAAPAAEKMRQCPNATCVPHDLELDNGKVHYNRLKKLSFT